MTSQGYEHGAIDFDMMADMPPPFNPTDHFRDMIFMTDFLNDMDLQ